jgi:(5-formylfuran-3-yl)methyl phosphate synthase
MRLLVSVRSAEEVEPALAGGADIIDAKEPELGSLGPVAPEVVPAIAALLPAETELSIALGDFSSPAQVTSAITGVMVAARPAPLYLKLGFAGITSVDEVADLLKTARAVARKHPAAPRIVAVAYADAALAGSAGPSAVCRTAVLAGADGLLLDTHDKGAGTLLDWLEAREIGDLIAPARKHGLLVALAGGLKLRHLDIVGSVQPDILGFRSAVCRGGRTGRVSSILVRRIWLRLNSLDSGFLQDAHFRPTPGWFAKRPTPRESRPTT